MTSAVAHAHAEPHQRSRPVCRSRYRARIESVPGVRDVGMLTFVGGYVSGLGRLHRGHRDRYRPRRHDRQLRRRRRLRRSDAPHAHRRDHRPRARPPLRLEDRRSRDGALTGVEQGRRLERLDVRYRRHLWRYPKARSRPTAASGSTTTTSTRSARSPRARSSFYTLRVDDADRAAAIGAEIDALFANSTDETLTQSEMDFFGAQIERVGNIGFIVNSIIGAVLFALLFVTGNTMMQSIRERVPELAVLKTYGYSNTAVNAARVRRVGVAVRDGGRRRSRRRGRAVSDDVRGDGRRADTDRDEHARRRRRARDRVRCRELVVADVARAALERRRRARGSLRGAAPCFVRSPPSPLMSLKSIPQRLGASIVVVVGIAAVVGVLVSVFTMAGSLTGSLLAVGSADRAIVLRSGANIGEGASMLPLDTAATVASAPGIARTAGRPQRRHGRRRHGRESAAAQQRHAARARRARRRRGEFLPCAPRSCSSRGGCSPPGLREAIVGRSAQTEFEGLELGATSSCATSVWTIVGVFTTGDATEAGLITDVDTLASAYGLGFVNSVTVRLESPAAFDELKAALDANPTLSVDVYREPDYFAQDAEELDDLVLFRHLRRLLDHGGRRARRRVEHDVRGRQQPRRGDRDAARAWASARPASSISIVVEVAGTRARSGRSPAARSRGCSSPAIRSVSAAATARLITTLDDYAVDARHGIRVGLRRRRSSARCSPPCGPRGCRSRRRCGPRSRVREAHERSVA